MPPIGKTSVKAAAGLPEEPYRYFSQQVQSTRCTIHQHGSFGSDESIVRHAAVSIRVLNRAESADDQHYTNWADIAPEAGT